MDSSLSVLRTFFLIVAWVECGYGERTKVHCRKPLQDIPTCCKDTQDTSQLITFNLVICLERSTPRIIFFSSILAGAVAVGVVKGVRGSAFSSLNLTLWFKGSCWRVVLSKKSGRKNINSEVLLYYIISVTHTHPKKGQYIGDERWSLNNGGMGFKQTNKQ